MALQSTSDLRDPVRRALSTPNHNPDKGVATSTSDDSRVRLEARPIEAYKRCEPLARARDGHLGRLRYRAPATFSDQDAVVEVFDLQAEPQSATKAKLRLRAYVMATSDCRLLNVQSFAP